jgi:hypothetical protein
MKQEMILKISEYIKEIERLKLELKESKINKSVGYNWSEVSSLNEPIDNFDSGGTVYLQILVLKLLFN